VKIAVGLNRRKCVDPTEARRLGSLSWREVLRGDAFRDSRPVGPEPVAVSAGTGNGSR
jgi:hypothetical protein